MKKVGSFLGDYVEGLLQQLEAKRHNKVVSMAEYRAKKYLQEYLKKVAG